MTIDAEMLDQILKDYKNPEDVLGKNGIFQQLKKALLEKILETEMTHSLGYERNQKKDQSTSNFRNGKTKKKVITDSGSFEIEVPRDREGKFEPKIIPKRQKRFSGFDDKIIAFYSRGLSVRDIKEELRNIYGINVSEGLISEVTDTVIEEVKAWQARPLESIYPIVFFDAIMIKIKDSGQIKNKAVYLALGVNMEGQKELLGIWIQETEGAKFWLQVMNELNNRGLRDIFIACIDGLNGFEEAIHGVFPKTQIQLCIVHMVRNSMKYVSFKDKKEIGKDLKEIYHAVNEEEGKRQLKKFEEKWDDKYPMISQSWKKNWSKLSVFYGYPAEIRRAIYTTNAIESLNHSLRKVLKTKGLFPNEVSVIKLMYLALKNISKKWTMPIKNWGLALNQFSIIFEGRF